MSVVVVAVVGLIVIVGRSFNLIFDMKCDGRSDIDNILLIHS